MTDEEKRRGCWSVFAALLGLLVIYPGMAIVFRRGGDLLLMFLAPLIAAVLGFVSWRLSPKRRILSCGGAVFALAAFVLLLVLYLTLFPDVERVPPRHCIPILNQLGKAMGSYVIDHDSRFPFERRGPLHSLGLLPEGAYVPDGDLFRCRAVDCSVWKRDRAARFPPGAAFAGERCDFGYTWRIPPAGEIPSDFVIVADMPWNHSEREDEAKGFTVLRADGSVSWETSPFCSHDPNDNIYAPEPGWSPDTDTWIRQK